MTKKEFNKNLNLCIKEIKPELLKKADKMINSGCVDLNNYENDFSLVKAFLNAALIDLGNQYKPFTKELQEESKNISCFI